MTDPASLCLVLKNMGVMSNASVNFLLSLTHSAEQSKFTKPHYKSMYEGPGRCATQVETDLVEIRAEGISKGVDLVQVKLLSVLWACKCNSSPCRVYVYPDIWVLFDFFWP